MFKKFAVAAAVLLIGSASAQAAKFNVSLDGFCNTFKLQLDSFEVYGKRSGCGYTVTDGGSDAFINGIEYYIPADQNPHVKDILVWYFTPPSGGAGNWYLYDSNGKSMTELNSGTYTVTSAAQHSPKAGGNDATVGRK
jgi:hypothetical protein